MDYEIKGKLKVHPAEEKEGRNERVQRKANKREDQ